MEDQKESKTPDLKEVGATQAMLRAENEGPETLCGDPEQKHEAPELRMQQQTAHC